MPYPVAGYPWLQTARPQGTSTQLGAGDIDTQDVNSGLLFALNAIGAALRKHVTIFSGYRTSAYSQQVGGFAGDPHSRGIAVDATIDGTPIGQVPGVSNLLSRYGLVSGNQPNFYQGHSDPPHVQLSTSSASSGSTTAPTDTQPLTPSQIAQEAHAAGAFPAWVDAVSRLTGMDPRVLVAWQKSEGSPGNGNGYFNYLNIQSATARSIGVTPTGTGPAGTAIFGNITKGILASQREITSIVGNVRGKTPRQQIAAIAASPWASSHYGGTGGPNLAATFTGIFGQSALDAQPIIGGADIAATAGTGSAADITSAGDKVLPNAIGAITGPFTSLADLIKWIGSNWDRMLEVVGGSVLVGVGLFLLGRQMMGKDTDISKLLSGQIAASARDKGYSEGVEHGRMYEEEKASAATQKQADRAAVKRQRNPHTATAYDDDIPF